MTYYAVCALMPQVLISLFGGVWADRYNRKYLIMISDGFIALATTLIALAFLLGYQKLGLLLAASVIRSLGAGVQIPAVTAAFPQLVPRENLTRIQGINQTLGSISMLASPAVGGLVLNAVGILGAFCVDIVTAILAISIMAVIKLDKAPRSTDQAPFWRELKEGLAYTFGVRGLRLIIICGVFAFLLITPAAFLSTLMVERSFGGEIWRLTANEILWASGTILGGIFVALKKQFHNKTKTIAISVVAHGIFFGLLGVSWNFTSYLIFMGLAGCFMPIMTTAQTVYMQEISSPNLLGRVISVWQFFTASAMPVAILFFGPLADIIKIEYIMIASGILLALTGLIYGRGSSHISGISDGV